jgi:hypothetical protein
VDTGAVGVGAGAGVGSSAAGALEHADSIVITSATPAKRERIARAPIVVLLNTDVIPILAEVR